MTGTTIFTTVSGGDPSIGCLTFVTTFVACNFKSQFLISSGTK